MKVLAADSESPEKARNARLCKRLDEAREGKPALAEVRLEVVGIGSTGARSFVLFGDGVGIWNGKKQFRIDSKTLRGLLKLIDKAGFCVWPERASQIGRENQPEVDPDAMQMNRAISLTIGDVSKTVTQIARSPESAAFTALVTRLLDACEKEGQRGIGAENLQDGLAKLRDGTLAPEVLQVTLNCPQQAATDPEGWLLRLRGAEVEVQRNTKTAGYTDRKSMRLSDQQIRDLAKLLFAANLAALPGNIVAPGYTDLRVSVLNQTKAIQARAFAGASPTARADAQETFSKVRGAFYDLDQRVAREGKAGGAW
jgi:hypothetical protein